MARAFLTFFALTLFSYASVWAETRKNTNPDITPLKALTDTQLVVEKDEELFLLNILTSQTIPAPYKELPEEEISEENLLPKIYATKLRNNVPISLPEAFLVASRSGRVLADYAHQQTYAIIPRQGDAGEKKTPPLAYILNWKNLTFTSQTIPFGPWDNYLAQHMDPTGFRYFSCGKSCYLHEDFTPANGSLFAHIYGKAYRDSYQGLYQLPAGQTKWQQIISGDISNVVISKSGCLAAWNKNNQLEFQQLCAKN